MEKSQPFVIPAGVTFQVSDAGLIIENAGDVVLHTTFGRPLSRVVSRAGDVELHGAITAGALIAAGGIRVNGALTAESVQAGGAVSVAGSATLGNIQTGGDLAVGGPLVAVQVDVGGGLSAQGDVGAQDLKARGDVAVAGNLTARRAEVAGAVSVKGALNSDNLTAAGTVSIGGSVQAGTIRAGDIQISGESVTARGLQATNKIQLGAGKIQIDAMIATEVHVDAKTAGRATIIESQNDLGTNAIKGGFRLEDYAEMFGDPAGYLRERGLSAPGEQWAGPAASGRAAPAAPPPATPVATAGAPEAQKTAGAPEAQRAAPEAQRVAPAQVIAAEPTRSIPPQVTHAAAATLPPGALMAVPAADPGPVEVVPEPVDETTAARPAGLPPAHPLHDKLVDAVGKIAERYGESEVPPAVAHLRDLIDARAYDEVRAEITSIWSDLVKFHQKHGLRIQHQVTTTFNTINSLVKKM